eukprot:14019041-Ditylum_brightwellii.AAC.1
MYNGINLINDNGGFTVVGWYTRGIISNQSPLTARMIVNNNNNNNNNNNISEYMQDIWGSQDDLVMMVSHGSLGHFVVVKVLRLYQYRVNTLCDIIPCKI